MKLTIPLHTISTEVVRLSIKSFVATDRRLQIEPVVKLTPAGQRWCTEHLRETIFVNSEWASKKGGVRLILTFKNEHDAMLFKLAWIGN